MHPADQKGSFSSEISQLLRKQGWYSNGDGWRETADRDRGTRPGLSEGEVVDELIRRDWARVTHLSSGVGN